MVGVVFAESLDLVDDRAQTARCPFSHVAVFDPLPVEDWHVFERIQPFLCFH